MLDPRNPLNDNDVSGNTFMWMQDQERERQDKLTEEETEVE